MPMFAIKSRYDGSVLFALECDSLKLCVEAVVEKKTDLRDAYLRDADLCDADLCDAYLRGADLSGANLRGANLGGADLRDADLCDADLCDANLRGANLGGADLRDADLCDADLCDADLSGANLRDAYLSGADLRGANLRDAYLRDAYLSGADLRGADLCDADLGKPGETTIDWTSHALIGEILWRAADGDTDREMVAAWIGRKTEWCWKEFGVFEHPQRAWALGELRKWVTAGDGAPDVLNGEPAAALAQSREVEGE